MRSVNKWKLPDLYRYR